MRSVVCDEAECVRVDGELELEDDEVTDDAVLDLELDGFEGFEGGDGGTSAIDPEAFDPLARSGLGSEL